MTSVADSIRKWNWGIPTVLHLLIAACLLLVVWVPLTDLEPVKERIVWGFPGPLMLLSPLVAFVGGSPRLRRFSVSADTGIAIAVISSLFQEDLRKGAHLSPPPILTTAQVYFLVVILALTAAGIVSMGVKGPTSTKK